MSIIDYIYPQIFPITFNGEGNVTGFLLSGEPQFINEVFVYRNGVPQVPGQDFILTTSNNTIQLLSNTFVGETIEIFNIESANGITDVSNVVNDFFPVTATGEVFFTLSQGTDDTGNYIFVNRNGVIQVPGLHYTVTGNVGLNLFTPCLAGETIFVQSLISVYESETTVMATVVAEIDTQGQSVFTLPDVPNSSNSLNIILTRNGVLQRPLTDYTLSGGVLTMAEALNLQEILAARVFTPPINILPFLINLSNPFANTPGPALEILNPVQSIGTNTTVQTSYTPSAPASFTQYLTNANVTGMITSLTSVSNLIANGTIVNFNTNQITAINNTLEMMIALNTPDRLPFFAHLPANITFTQTQLQSMIVSTQAIQSIATTGLLITQQDLNSSNSMISAVQGFSPNGWTLTCHDQHFIGECYPYNGQWAVSNVGSGGTGSWDPLAVGVMETFSDQPIAVTQYIGLVVVFGLQSYEFYEDTGAAPMPYQIVPGTAQQYGLVGKKAFTSFVGSVAFLGRNKTGQAHIFMLNGTSTPTQISTDDLDEIINSLTVINDCFAYAYDNNGHNFVRFVFPNGSPVNNQPAPGSRTFDYDGTPGLGIWNEVKSGTLDTIGRHLTSLACTFGNRTLASDWATGNVYIIDPNNYTDNGFPIERRFVSKHMVMDDNLYTVSKLALRVQTGTGSQTGALIPYGTNPKILLQVSYDDGYTWTDPEAAELGEVGKYWTEVVWRQLGDARTMTFKFTVTDPVPFVILSGYIE